jgi:hypothetical protein
MLGPTRVLLQPRQILGVAASLPAVKSLGADIIVAAGETSIVPMGMVIVKPF